MNLTDTTLALKHFQSSHEEANAAALEWCKLLGISPEDWSRWSDFTPLIAKLVSASQANADAAKMAEMERDELKAENTKLRERESRIRELCTTDHESKSTFIARVLAVLHAN